MPNSCNASCQTSLLILTGDKQKRLTRTQWTPKSCAPERNAAAFSLSIALLFTDYNRWKLAHKVLLSPRLCRVHPQGAQRRLIYELFYSLALHPQLWHSPRQTDWPVWLVHVLTKRNDTLTNYHVQDLLTERILGEIAVYL